MKTALVTLLALISPFFVLAQIVDSDESNDCDIEVSYGTLIDGTTDDYDLTDAVAVSPGGSADLYGLPTPRRIYSAGVSHDEIIVIRFPSTGITHYTDRNMDDPSGIVLVGGCSTSTSYGYTRDGEFHLDSDGY